MKFTRAGLINGIFQRFITTPQIQLSKSRWQIKRDHLFHTTAAARKGD